MFRNCFNWPSFHEGTRVNVLPCVAQELVQAFLIIKPVHFKQSFFWFN
jgi:hypothetical protein